MPQTSTARGSPPILPLADLATHFRDLRMTCLHSFRRLARLTVGLGLAAVATACTPGNKRLTSAPIPNRSTDDLTAELRARHNDLLDAIGRGSAAGVAKHLAANALLVLPTGDTIRGSEQIVRQVERLTQTLRIESVRATAAAELVRCTDGLLERTGDWTMQIVRPDDSREFKRDMFGVRWTTNGDSLQISMITLASRTGLAEEESQCVSVDALKFSGTRVAAFFMIGNAMPVSYTAAAAHEYGQHGYGTPRLAKPDLYPEGHRPDAPELIGLSGRLTHSLWLTATTPMVPQNFIIGKRNPSSYSFVNINRLHRPVGVTLDYNWRQFTFGAGPALAIDGWFYQEVLLAQTSTGSGVHSSANYNKTKLGASGNASLNMAMAPNMTMMFRGQLFAFPTEQLPRLSTGEDVRIRDLQMIFGVGFKLAY
jgi:hypothetical protein